MERKKPLRKEGVMARKLGDEWLLYDSAAGTVHIVNSTAEFVWRLCDGSHNGSEIEAKMRENYQFSESSDIKGDIEDILDDFSDLGILNS